MFAVRCLHDVRERKLGGRIILAFLHILHHILQTQTVDASVEFSQLSPILGKHVESALDALLPCQISKKNTARLKVLKVLEYDVSKLNPESYSVILHTCGR